MAPLGLETPGDSRYELLPKIPAILRYQAVTDDACCEATRQALVLASDYPLSIVGASEPWGSQPWGSGSGPQRQVMIGVGDGPWDVMKDCLAPHEVFCSCLWPMAWSIETSS